MEINQNITKVLKLNTFQVLDHPTTIGFFANQIGSEYQNVFNQEKGYALQLLQENENLANCTAISLQSALFSLVKQGLTLDPVKKFATLVPYKNKAVLQISYLGKIELLTRNNIIKSIKHLEMVYGGDTLTMKNGKIDHTIDYLSKRDVEHGVVIQAVLNDGSEKHIFVSKAECDKRASKSKMPNIWREWREQMCKKTAVNELYKYLPKGSNIPFDDSEEDDVDADVIMYSEKQRELHDMLGDSHYSEDVIEKIENILHEISDDRCQKYIDDILINKNNDNTILRDTEV